MLTARTAWDDSGYSVNSMYTDASDSVVCVPALDSAKFTDEFRRIAEYSSAIPRSDSCKLVGGMYWIASRVQTVGMEV